MKKHIPVIRTFKKIILSSLSLILILSMSVRPVMAAKIYSLSALRLVKYDRVRTLTDILIEADDDREITAESDIGIIIPEALYLTFEPAVTTLSFTGTASAKISPDVTYSEDAKTLYIDVTEDFSVGDILTVNGVQVRVYNQGNRAKNLGLDIDNDGIIDATDLATIEIEENNSRRDTTVPYPVRDVKINILADRHELSWKLPIDLDIVRVDLKLGDSGEIVTQGIFTSYIDTAKNSSYTLTVHDSLNTSETVTVLAADFEEVAVGNIPEVTPMLDEESTEEKKPDLDDKLTGARFISDIFTDVEDDDEAAEAILSLYDEGIIQGRSEGQFIPKGTANRAEFSKMVALYFLLDIKEGASSFPDVTSDVWYGSYIAAVAKAGIMKGDHGLAMPNREISRAEAITMIIRAIEYTMGEELVDTDPVMYTDVLISDWFYPVISKALAIGLLDWVGTGGELLPYQPITRAELSQLIVSSDL